LGVAGVIALAKEKRIRQRAAPKLINKQNTISRSDIVTAVS
jgi:hypothetical protein